MNGALLIPSTTSARNLYIGVHAFRGAGHFALSADVTSLLNANVCTVDSSGNKKTFTSAQLSSARAYLQGGAAYLYAYTNGMLFRNSFTLNTGWSGSCTTQNGCDICLYDDPGMAVGSFGQYLGSSFPCGHIDFHAGSWDTPASAWGFAHESGHSCFNLPDEYQRFPPAGDASPRYCGHTAMANSSRATGYCAWYHCYDGQISDVGACENFTNPPLRSNWDMVRTVYWFYAGPHFGYNIPEKTPYPTPSWNNEELRSIVTTTGF
jgi:hypothetical protein